MPKIIETRTIIETIYYLLKKLGTADKIKLLKLVYLADKYHLIYYGRTVTNDDYYAMKFGPVPSTVKDILEFDKNVTISDDEYKYASSLFEKSSQNNFKVKKGKFELDMLSETDKEALDYVIKEFGSMTQWDLSEYTHRYPEWYQYKDLFEKGRTSRERINTKELLSKIDKHFPVPPEHLEESKKIVNGDFD